jgi:Ca-activated chloride channel family protein
MHPLWLMLPLLSLAGEDEDEEAIEFDMDMPAAAPRMSLERLAPAKLKVPAPAVVPDVSGNFSATAGGMQDIQWARQQIFSGGLPGPDSFTAEGLLSEHDLPARMTAPCTELLCVVGEAHPAAFAERQEVRALAQLGFSSKLNPATWVRPALDLVVVADQSAGIGDGDFLQLQASVLVLAGQLEQRDRLTIIALTDQGPQVLLDRVPGDAREDIAWAVQAFHRSGGTNLQQGLEAGLRHGIAGRRDFQGLSRVLVLSDWRPSAGNLEPDQLGRMARLAAQSGVGMSAIGVGASADPRFQAELSSVRGGNGYHFPDTASMVEAFREEFLTMMVPLAQDFALEIQPASGWRLAGVYGIPGEALLRESSGTVRLKVPTLFLSSEGGAIVLAFAPEGVGSMPPVAPGPGASLATIGLAYTPMPEGRPGAPVLDMLSLQLEPAQRASEGWTRCRVLVDEIEVLTASLKDAQRGDYRSALERVGGLRDRMDAQQAPWLAPERALVQALYDGLAWRVPDSSSLL